MKHCRQPTDIKDANNVSFVTSQLVVQWMTSGQEQNMVIPSYRNSAPFTLRLAYRGNGSLKHQVISNTITAWPCNRRNEVCTSRSGLFANHRMVCNHQPALADSWLLHPLDKSFTDVPLSPGSIIWYWTKARDARSMGTSPRAWWKVMADVCLAR